MNAADTYIENRYDRRRIGKSSFEDFGGFGGDEGFSYDPGDYGWSVDAPMDATTGDLGVLPDPNTTIFDKGVDNFDDFAFGNDPSQIFAVSDPESDYIASITPDEESAYVDSIRRGSLGSGRVIDEESVYVDSIRNTSHGSSGTGGVKVFVDVLDGIAGIFSKAAKGTSDVIRASRNPTPAPNGGIPPIIVAGRSGGSGGGASIPPSREGVPGAGIGGFVGNVGGLGIVLIAGILALFIIAKR